MSEDSLRRALEDAAFTLQGGPEAPAICTLCGTTYPDRSYEYGSTVYYGQPDDGFHCNACEDPLAGYSGCEGCAKPLGPLCAVTLIDPEEGVALVFHQHCVNADDLRPEILVEKETHEMMLSRWAEDLQNNADYNRKD